MRPSLSHLWTIRIFHLDNFTIMDMVAQARSTLVLPFANQGKALLEYVVVAKIDARVGDAANLKREPSSVPVRAMLLE